LNVSAELNKIFLSTNRIENVIRNLRLATGSVKRWKTNGGSDMVSRWVATGLIRAEQGFRLILSFNGFRDIPITLLRTPCSSAPNRLRWNRDERQG
jgi:hypothetical protein